MDWHVSILALVVGIFSMSVAFALRSERRDREAEYKHTCHRLDQLEHRDRTAAREEELARRVFAYRNELWAASRSREGISQAERDEEHHQIFEATAKFGKQLRAEMEPRG